MIGKLLCKLGLHQVGPLMQPKERMWKDFCFRYCGWPKGAK